MIYPPFCLGSTTLCILLGAGHTQAKQGGVGTALEAMLLSTTLRYLVAQSWLKKLSGTSICFVCHPESHKNPPHHAYDAIPRTLAHPFYLSELASP